MGLPNFQIININLSKHVFKKPIVCDISPFPFQVINVQGLSEQQLLQSVQALASWDMRNAISVQELGGKK
jgi:hypothetical protein